MKRTFWTRSLGFVVILITTLSAYSQNVTNYDQIPNPFLFLLREPAVHKDLKLSDIQLQKLTELNGEIDGPLLASRNKEGADKTVTELIAQSKAKVAAILDSDQERRLEQIVARTRGIKAVVMEPLAQKLRLKPSQIKQIQGTLHETLTLMKKVTEDVQAGKKQQPAAVKELTEARKREQEMIFEQLSTKQRQTLISELGPVFDINQLGRVSFKAPEFSTGEQWLNSKPLRLADLKGEVIALHYFAFA